MLEYCKNIKRAFFVPIVGKVLDISTLPSTDHKLKSQVRVFRVSNKYSTPIASIAITLMLKAKT